MHTIGRFLRWLFLDPIREVIQATTVVLIAAYAMTVFVLANEAKRQERQNKPCNADKTTDHAS